jgi:hypothetical protein
MATTKKVQVGDEFTEFTYKDLNFKVPTGDKIPSEAAVAFDTGRGLRFVELLLGADQWRKVLKVAPTLGELKEFCDALYGAMDTSAGE